MTRSAIFRFLANARFFLYGAFVVFSLYIIWLEVLPTNLGESRDRAIHLSLPIVFELSFLAAFLVEKWCRSKLGERANDIPSGEAHRPRALDLVNLVPVIGGCYFAFRGYAPLGICFVA